MTTKTSSLLDAIKVPSSPFPGLRPFESNESDLFFGRDEQIEKLMTKLTANRFLAVVGTSGSGKSSLVRAGLMHALRSGMMTAAGSKWRIAVMHPSNDPIGNLARALNSPEVFGSEDARNLATQVAVAEATLRLGSRGLIEVVRQNAMPDNENLLVVVDQFEEIFRFAREARKMKMGDDLAPRAVAGESHRESQASERVRLLPLHERNQSIAPDADTVPRALASSSLPGGRDYDNDAAAFVKLLLEAVKSNEAGEHLSDNVTNVYVLLTMRSDFLGDCAKFWGLPEAINESQYLIPRLTRDQLREVIEGPVAVCGGELAPRLINQLLNDTSDNQDQLPILQHALMRTWDEWKHSRHEHQSSPKLIDSCCYEAIGGMANALSKHADEAYDELPDQRHRQIAEKMFKALTEKGEDNREIRRPVLLRELCAVAGQSEKDVKTVIEIFRGPGRSFLMPPVEMELTADTLIDISHESLIRIWKRLQQWVNEEAESRGLYLLLAEAARRGRELWYGSDLDSALEWQKKYQPSEPWAQRYHANFDGAMAFLLASRRKCDEDRAKEERQRREEAERAKRDLAQAQALAEAQREAAEAERQKVEQQQQRIEEQARTALRMRRFLVALFITALLAGLAAGLAFYAYKRADAEKANATRQQEIAESTAHVANMNLAQAEFESGNLPRGFDLIESYLPAESATPKLDKLRSFYWYYLWHQNHNEQATLKGHGFWVKSVAFSPDGRTIASGSNDSTVKLWDAKSGQEQATLKGYGSDVTSVAFSPDGRTIASGSVDSTVKLWDAKSGQEQATLKGHGGGVRSVAFSPDGRTLASGSDHGPDKLWDAKSGQERATLKGHGGAVFSVVFSPDGRTLASASDDGTVKLWDANSGRELATLKGHGHGVNSVAFSPDGRTLASASSDSTVKLWRGATDEEVARQRNN